MNRLLLFVCLSYLFDEILSFHSFRGVKSIIGQDSMLKMNNYVRFSRQLLESTPIIKFKRTPDMKSYRLSSMEYDSIWNIYYVILFSFRSEEYKLVILKGHENTGKEILLTVDKNISESVSHQIVITGLAVFHHHGKNVLFHRSAKFGNISMHKFEQQIVNIIIHPIINSYTAVIDRLMNLYITQDQGNNWKLFSNKVTGFIWASKSVEFFFTKQISRISRYSVLMKGNVSNTDFYEIFKRCIELKNKGDIIYTTILSNYKIKVFISFNGGAFREAIFPTHLDPTDIEILPSFNHEIFIYVLNISSTANLFRGRESDLKFVKILSYTGVYSHYDFNLICTYIYRFRKLPGLLLTKISEGHDSGFKKYRTIISFNYGSNWQHINFVRNTLTHDCNWPRCYISLLIPCHDTYKDDIIQAESSPNILLALGIIVNDGLTIIHGLFISTDAGQSWD